MGSCLLKVFDKLPVFKSKLVEVGVSSEGVRHEVEVKLEQQQDARFVEKLYFFWDEAGEISQKLAALSIAETKKNFVINCTISWPSCSVISAVMFLCH